MTPEAGRMRRIGLLGGSFDPVHCAHIALAECAYRILELDCVRLIPAANPWQKAPLAASTHHRLAMLELAIAGREWLTVDTVEIRRGGASYTVDTVRELPPENDYYWIMGSDQLKNFCTWHAWEDIVAHVHLAVAVRPGAPLQTPDALHERLTALGRPIVHLPFTPAPVSATQIREHLAHDRTPDSWLDPAVLRYIQHHHLYHA